MTTTDPLDPAAVKACCAAAYSQDAVALLLGESYHPGGLALTRRLGEALGLRPGQKVIDVAAGPGTTARLLASEYRVSVDGVDLAEATVRRARRAAAEAGVAARVRFYQGDAERVPLADQIADAVVCECALCTFPDKPAAAAEFARVLRPGGKVGITDITVAAGGLPARLRTLAGWVACLADARPLTDYVQILAGAGLRTTRVEDHDRALAKMIGQIEARLRVLAMSPTNPLAVAGIDLDVIASHLELARRAVTAAQLRYRLLIAEKPR